MPIDTIAFNGKLYPAFQATGNASRFCMPFAMEVCKGTGFDIGCNRDSWKLPGAIGIDPAIDKKYDAYNLPIIDVDYIFSSHCLEHLSNWVVALDYWTTKLRRSGVLFLYLPAPTQEYWLPFNNRKHIHVFHPDIIRKYLEASGKYKNIFVSGIDAYDSFTVMAEKL